MSTEALSPGQTLRCARHPNTETVLRCGRCETPICPRCAIQTPVGARCPTCARVKRFAMLLKPRELARAIGYGIGAAAAGTLILGFIPFLGLIGWALLGFVVAEAVSVGANRKRVRELAPIAVACVLLGYELGGVLDLVRRAPPGLVFTPALVAALLLSPILEVTRGLQLLGILLAVLVAWLRAR
jgi:hypothetical protein